MTPQTATAKIIDILEANPSRWCRYTIGDFTDDGIADQNSQRCLRGLFLEVSGLAYPGDYGCENSSEEAFARFLGFTGSDPVQDLCNWNNDASGPEEIIYRLKEAQQKVEA